MKFCAKRPIYTVLMSAMLLAFTCQPNLAHAQSDSSTSHYWGKVEGVWFQGPTGAIQIGNDQLIDLGVLSHVTDIKVESRDDEVVYKYFKHTLDVKNGRNTALLDGRIVLLAHAPVVREGHLLIPFKQSLILLQVPFREEQGVVNVKACAGTWKQIKHSGVTENGKAVIGFLGLIDQERMVLATQPRIFGKVSGLGVLYEGKWGSQDGWKLNKLRPLTDTSATVYMEWMPNGNVTQNLFLDSRPEMMVVETCSCAGIYNYATMFTVTEMGLTSIWHSQYSYDRIERSNKGWELVSYRKEKIPERPSGALPYWEVRETWTGTQFSIIKETYHAPDKQ